MIRDAKAWAAWEAANAEPADYHANLRWMEDMIEHARGLGVWPPDPWEGLEEKLAWIRRLHGCVGVRCAAGKARP